jgi:hypothetical protein
MASIFENIFAKAPSRNSFNLSHCNKLTTDFGALTPIYVEDLVPGDYFKGHAKTFMRFAPLIAPIMHEVNVYTHFFFVPRRLVCRRPDSSWEDFITGKGLENGQDRNPPNLVDLSFTNDPAILNDGFSGLPRALAARGSLVDYMGLPVRRYSSNTEVFTHLDFPRIDISSFIAYQLIYNEYYRDQNLQPEIDLNWHEWASVSNRELYRELFTLRYRAWEKDYFTAALPFTQKGEAVKIPVIQGGVPIVRNPNAAVGDGYIDLYQASQPGNVNPPTGNASFLTAFQSNIPPMSYLADADAANGASIHSGAAGIQNQPGSLTHAFETSEPPSATTVNDLRTSFQLQKWLELNARAGSRYVEQILAHFGVRSKDARLQRPEYIGGGKADVSVSEVVQTSGSTEGGSGALASPQGNMAGHAYSLGKTNNFSYKATEHGYIIGLMSVMPRTGYMDGIPRHFMRRDRYMHYWPAFAHLGEQPVFDSEVFHELGNSSVAITEQPFGYMPRYTEYRYHPSRVHGDFLNMDGLADWHMDRAFDAKPSLNGEFISTGDATHRIFAVESDEQPLWAQVNMQVHAVRPMPVSADPGFIDH